MSIKVFHESFKVLHGIIGSRLQQLSEQGGLSTAAFEQLSIIADNQQIMESTNQTLEVLGRVEQGQRLGSIMGMIPVTFNWGSMLGIRITVQTGHTLSEKSCLMIGACMTCTAMSGNGVWIGNSLLIRVGV